MRQSSRAWRPRRVRRVNPRRQRIYDALDYVGLVLLALLILYGPYSPLHHALQRPEPQVATSVQLQSLPIQPAALHH